VAEQPSQQRAAARRAQPPSRPPKAAYPNQAGQVAGLLTMAAGQAPAAAVAAGGVAVGTAAGILAGAALARLLRLMVEWGYDRRAARAAVRVTLTVRRAYTVLPGDGPATRGAMAREPVYDAWFLLNTARRVQERMAAGKNAEDAIRPERQYVEQRERARVERRKAAETVDAEARQPGQLRVDGRVVLAWRAHNDDRTTWECVAADGRWFYADTPPLIGYPGMPHGGTCRCVPTRATALTMTGPSVDEAIASAQGTADHPAETIPDPVPIPGDGEAAAS